MRRAETGSGHYNIPNVGIFLWRLQPFRLSSLPLSADPADTSGRRFRVNPLGADMPLFRSPITEPDTFEGNRSVADVNTLADQPWWHAVARLISATQSAKLCV